MKQLKMDIAVGYRAEENFWREKSRQLWLISGDMNTKYFHNIVKGMKSSNPKLMFFDDLGAEHFS